jgi:hypothetical protein
MNMTENCTILQPRTKKDYYRIASFRKSAVLIKPDNSTASHFYRVAISKANLSENSHFFKAQDSMAMTNNPLITARAKLAYPDAGDHPHGQHGSGIHFKPQAVGTAHL